MTHNPNAHEKMNIVIAGHVDHGKSTVIGRMLADTGSLPKGKLEQIRQMCEKTSKPFEYAFLLDALKDEQSQGITIDSARVFFKTKKREYLIIDAPGHIEFLKNMVTGASHAEAAVLVIDAKEGVQENSRRHGYMLSMLGIRQVAVLVNKMDRVGYQQDMFEQIKTGYTAFLKQIDIAAAHFIPVSGREGDNITGSVNRMKWYRGACLLDVLDAFVKEKPDSARPFRMPIQDVYKFTKQEDSRRIVVGTVESGSVAVGDEVLFYPSGKKSAVRSIEGFNQPVQKEASVGRAAGFTLTEQIYIGRGEIAAKSGEQQPLIGKRLKVSIFWLGRKPFQKNKDYLFKLGTVKVNCRLEAVHRLINASDLSSKEKAHAIGRHDVAECTLLLNRPIAFDTSDFIASTGRFVIVDTFEIAGGGIVREALPDKLSWVRDKVILRNYKWEKSMISAGQKAEKYNQKACLILITGSKGSGKKETAKKLEADLFGNGRWVYFLGIGNVLYGVDADIKKGSENREEHLRRLAEVAHILLDTGIILIITSIDMTQDDLEIIKTTVNPDLIQTVWAGDHVTTDIACDLRIPGIFDVEESVKMLKQMLQDKGVVFKVW